MPQPRMKMDEEIALAEFFDRTLPALSALGMVVHVPPYYGERSVISWLRAEASASRTVVKIEDDDEVEMGS